MRNLWFLVSVLFVIGCSGSNNNASILSDDGTAAEQEVSPSAGVATSAVDGTAAQAGQATEQSTDQTGEQKTEQNVEQSTEQSVEEDVVNSLINRDNYRALLVQAFEVFSGRAYDDRLNSSSYVSSHDVPVCESGVVDQISVVQYNFNNCVIDGEALNGQVHRGFDFESAQLIFSNGFSSDLGGLGEMRVSGVYDRTCCSSSVAFSTYAFGYEFSYVGGNLTVNDATVDTNGNDTTRTMSGTFSMQGTSTDGALISVATSDWLSLIRDDSSSAAWGSNTGALSLTASDGSRLDVQANTGDLSTVEITITDASGVHTIIESWDVFIEAITWSSAVKVQSLHFNAGQILNKLAGEDLIALSNELVDNLQYALNTASSFDVAEPVITFDTSTNPATETNITVSSYQCSNGGSIDRTQTTVGYQEGGFYFLGEHSDTDTYVMKNCVFPDVALSNYNVALNGQYSIEGATRSGRKHYSTSTKNIWESFHQVRTDESNLSTEHFVSAQLLQSSYNHDTATGSYRGVTITDYELIDLEGVKESIETSDFNQGQDFGSYSGLRQSYFEVEGGYTGPLTDHNKVSVSTQAQFAVDSAEFSDPSGPESIPATGDFTLASANGDTVNIVLTSDVKDSYYVATFNTFSTDGSKPLSLELPFYKYIVEGKGFAEAQWTIASE